MRKPVASLRRVLLITGQLALVALASYLAFWLRFDGSVPPGELRHYLLALPWLLLLRLLAFDRFRVFEVLWRYTGLWDLRNLIVATGIGSIAFFLVVRFLIRIQGYPRSIYLIEPLLTIFFLGGLRLAVRTYQEVPSVPVSRRVLIMGAGDAGAMIAREMKSKPHYGGSPVGFVDDDRKKHGRYIYGIRVQGGRDRLSEIMTATHPDEVLIAMPSLAGAALRDVVASFEPYALPLKTLPNLAALSTGRVSLGEIRPLAIEDLLERPPVGLDAGAVRELIRGRRILVTGAGGSIGSELCRQVAAFEPASLIMLDRYENGLYEVEKDIVRLAAEFSFVPVIADITDAHRVDEILTAHQPEIIFHAAAHKHVPLMERNPCEAVKNNVRGTRLLIDAAGAHGVRSFILISTDKAVNPTSVMGATKRVAERLVQSMGEHSTTTFAAVRFGNVLGSTGSVVPLFRQQIREGGPVTVTHSEMRRFFMLIPEAVQLVLHAAAKARGGEIFVLDMGKPVKVIDMARNLIRLSGSRPDIDVPIALTGLRPGEKLEEELLAADEEVDPSPAEKISQVRPGLVQDPITLAAQVRQLEEAALAGDDATALRMLKAIVPTYTPTDAAGALIEDAAPADQTGLTRSPR